MRKTIPAIFGTCFWRRVGEFFPVKLFINQLQHNQLIILMWFLPYLIITGILGKGLGIPSLFLAPDYMGQISPVSFLFMGLATGSFIIAYHITSYILMSYRFPFIVTLKRPFYIFSLNNSFVPFVYLILFLAESFRFQTSYELIPEKIVIQNLISFLGGNLLFIILSLTFFNLMNHLIKSNKTIITEDVEPEKKKETWFQRIIKRSKEKKVAEAPVNNRGKDRIGTYIQGNFSIAPSKDFREYDKHSLSKVFHQQHINTLIFILSILIFIIIRGLIKNHPALILPAGASLQLFFTLILLAISLFYLLFKNWTFLVLLILFIIGSYTTFNKIDSYNDSAYGLYYPKEEKSVPFLKSGNFHADSLNTIMVLEKWKQKFTELKNGNKPKMVIICTTGGGLKLAVWTYYSLAYADSATGNQLLKHTQLITGASGGMVGAAYIRALYLKKVQGKIKHIYKPEYWRAIGKDVLNPVIYSFAMSDWFFRLQTFSYNGHKYFQDRGYMLEQTLNRNLGPLLNKPLYKYRKPEEQAEIPMLIFSPSIINSGARMLISPLGISYLTRPSYNLTLKNIEFRHAYKNFGADSLRFLTAIRMNASFPYVSPIVALPGKPTLSVMDAGLNDNLGFMTAYSFIMTFKTWINKNTDGLIIIRVAENDKINYIQPRNLVDRILQPIGIIYDDWFNIQENNYFSALGSLKKVLNGKMEIIHFGFGSKKKRVSLSWHLTSHGKKIIHEAIYSKENKRALTRLKEILKDH